MVDGVVGGGDRGEQGALGEGGGGAGLVGPRVGGEPGGRAEVLAGGGQVVHIAPLGSAGVHCTAVTMDRALGGGGCVASREGAKGGDKPT